jgi:hypothetical protein
MQRVKAKIRPRQRVQAKSLSVGGTISLSQIKEIDSSNATDGAVLLYDGNESKFKITTQINNPNTKILGGGF